MHRAIVVEDIAHLSSVEIWGCAGEKREGQAEDYSSSLHVDYWPKSWIFFRKFYKKSPNVRKLHLYIPFQATAWQKFGDVSAYEFSK